MSDRYGFEKWSPPSLKDLDVSGLRSGDDEACEVLARVCEELMRASYCHKPRSLIDFEDEVEIVLEAATDAGIHAFANPGATREDVAKVARMSIERLLKREERRRSRFFLRPKVTLPGHSFSPDEILEREETLGYLRDVFFMRALTELATEHPGYAATAAEFLKDDLAEGGSWDASPDVRRRTLYFYREAVQSILERDVMDPAVTPYRQRVACALLNIINSTRGKGKTAFREIVVNLASLFADC